MKFLVEPKVNQDQEKQMFPEMFQLTDIEILKLKGGMESLESVGCDAVCLPSEMCPDKACDCLSNLA